VHAFTNAFMTEFMERFTCAVKDATILQTVTSHVSTK
jgi:hypothetical protein